MWLSIRMTKMLYNKVRDQFEGKEDLLNQIYTEFQYEDLHRDSEDMKVVNYRYSDHRDRSPPLSYWNHMAFKTEADKAKQAHKFYKYGTDSYVQWFFSKLQ